MAVTERFSEKVKKIPEGESTQVIVSLITQERTQKLDLLIHLINNLKQPLIICGPKGIGKTTLLKIFQERTAKVWPIIAFSATELLGFEKIQASLLQGLTPAVGGSVSQNLSAILHGLEKLNKRVVLIIDDARLLEPGLMSKLTQYAATYPCLRIVFALSDEEVAAKRVTDSAVDNCHFIEIPTLSETQCGEFLQQLSTGLDPRQLMSEVTDGVAQVNKIPKLNSVQSEQLYKQTKGIPGKIAEALPNLSSTKTMRGLNWRFVLPAAGAVTLLAAMLTINHSGEPVEQKAALVIPGQTAPASEPELTEAEAIEMKQAAQPLIPETPAKADPYKGFVRAREGDSLDDFKEAMPKPAAQNAPSEQVDIKIMPVEPAANVAGQSQMPAVPSGMAEADMVIADVKSGSKQEQIVSPASQVTKPVSKNNAAVLPNVTPAPVVVKPKATPVVDNKQIDEAAKQAKLSKLKELEAKKLLEAQDKLLLAKKQKAEALEKAKLKQKELAEKEALKIAESSKQKIVLPDYVEPKPVSAQKLADVKEQLKNNLKEKAKAEVLVKPRNPIVVEAKPVAPPTVAKIKTPVVEEIKPVVPQVIIAKILKPSSVPVAPVNEKSGGGRYTLQVISFTQPALVEAFMRKHSGMGGLRSITINNGGNPKYVVVYGAFGSNAEANAAKKKLPGDFSQAFARKM